MVATATAPRCDVRLHDGRVCGELLPYIRGKYRRHLHPNPGAQIGFWRDRISRYPLYQGGFGSGKTYILVAKLLSLAAENRCNGMIVAETYGQLKQILVPEILVQGRRCGYDPRYMVADSVILLQAIPDDRSPYGCVTIYGRSADKAERIAGVNIGYGAGDEVARWPSHPHDPHRDPLTQFKARLRMLDTPGPSQLIFATTPEGRGRVWELWESDPDEDHTLYRGSTRDNAAHLDGDYIASLERSYGADLARQYLDGHAVDLAGLTAYSAFSDANLAPTFYSPALPVYVWHDFNVSPLVAGYGQPQGSPPDAEMHVLGECVIRSGGQTADIGRAVVERLRGVGHSGEVVVFGDASGAAGGTRSRLDDWMILARVYRDAFGDAVTFCVPAANPPVTERVARVNAALCDMTGRRRLLLDPERCIHHVRDLRSVKWRTSTTATGLPQIDKRDPELTHTSDALGYMCHIAYCSTAIRDTGQVGGRRASADMEALPDVEDWEQDDWRDSFGGGVPTGPGGPSPW